MAPLLVLVTALAASGLQTGPLPADAGTATPEAGVLLVAPDAGVAPGADAGVLAPPRLIPVEPRDGGVVTAPARAAGPETGEPVDAQRETIVTASREARRPDQEGRAVNVLTQDELSRHPPRTTPEALRDEEGVFVQRTNTGGGAPILRGLLGQHVLILVDGVRVNNATTRAGPNQSLNTVDPFWVEQVEILRGPGGVLYGSDAIGGVVNVITPRPRFSGEEEVAGNAQLRLLAGSADRSLQGHLNGGLSLPDTAVQGGVTGREFNDLTGGARVGVQRYTAYQEYDAAVKVRQRVSPGVQLFLQYQAVRQGDAPRTDRSVPGDFRLFAQQERDLGHARAEFSSVGPFRLAADLSVQRQEERQERFRVERDRIDREDVTVWSYAGKVEATTSPVLERLGRTTLTLGADTTVDRVLSRTSAGTLSAAGGFVDHPELNRYPPASQVAAGGYAFVTTDPAPYGVRVGVRLQYNGLRHGTDHRLSQLFGGEPLPAGELQSIGLAAELGVTRALAPGVTGLVNLSTAFRAPNVDDALRLGVEGPGFVVPTGRLRPEQAYTAEGGLRLVRGILTLQAYYAFTHITGLVAAVPAVIGGDTVTPDGLRYLERRNTERADVHAVDGSAQVRLPGSLRLTATYGWVHASQHRLDAITVQSVTEPMSKTPPPTGTVRLGYEPHDGLFAEAALRWAMNQRRLSEADRGDVRICAEGPGCDGTPGFLTLHLRGGYRFSDHLAATLVVQNLTDETYRYHASGIDEPGRSVVVGLEGAL